MQEKLAALSRYNVPEDERVSHMLYVEEAHNFIGDFESILSETRKFNLHLVLATQAIDQLAKPAASAVFANCASLISFRDNVIETSTRGWTMPRAELEAKLARFLKRIFNGTQSPRKTAHR